MTNENNMKRSVSLYSFQHEYFTGKLDLEGCIKKVSEFGADGIEILGDAMIPGYPILSNTFIEKWNGWMEKYNVKPICHDMFLDIQINKKRNMSIEEQVDSLVKDIIYAHKLGCKIIRCVGITPAETLRRAVPYAEQFGVVLAFELHSPWNFESDCIKEILDVIYQVNSPYLGLLPDCGIFCRKFPRILAEKFLRMGAQEKCVRYLTDLYNNNESFGFRINRLEDCFKELGKLEEKLKSMGANQADLSMLSSSLAYSYNDPKTLLTYMPHIYHIHAKFCEMLDDYTEYSIPYDEIISVLKQGTYKGYLSSEYEGMMYLADVDGIDAIEQVRREQVMLKNLIG